MKILALNRVPKKAGHYVYIDNYFTSLRLLRELNVHDIYCTGATRWDRVEGAPIIDLWKAQTGTHDVLQATNGAVRLVRWQDNSEVLVASNWDDP